jgi:SAM-dependent methyltransferase
VRARRARETTDVGFTLGKRWFAFVYGPVDRLQRRHTAHIRQELLGDLRGDILDVGIGPGTNFEHYGPGPRVVALDYNEHMLTMARRARAPGASIELVHGDAMALPFPDASFDAYVTTLVLCSVPDLDGALAEAWRVLRPGGEIRAFEHVRSSTPWKARIQRWLTPVWGVVADGCHLDRDTAGAVRARGFTVIEERHPSLRSEPLPLLMMRARKPATSN